MKRKYYFLLLAVLGFGVILPLTAQDLEPRPVTIEGKTYTLFTQRLDKAPGFPSPVRAKEGVEVLVTSTKDGKFFLVPVTIGDRPGKWRQLHIDGDDFPALASAGLHSEGELERARTITGRSVSEVTALARPERLSTCGFLSYDEDIISVLKGDNRLVKKLGLTHPKMARTLLHTCNMLDTVWHTMNFLKRDRHHTFHPYFLYNGKKIFMDIHWTKGGQESIFDDEITGALSIHIHREFTPREEAFLKKKYAHLDKGKITLLMEKISSMHSAEMEPYYIMRYGFYEGHTDYRTDPIAIAFIYGLKTIEEIEAAFPGTLFQTLTEHFTRPTPGQQASRIDEFINKFDTRYWDIYRDKLAIIGEPALDPLIDTMNRNAKWFGERAAYTLGKFKSQKAIDALMSALKNKSFNTRLRRAAADALGNIGDPQAIETLKWMLENEGKWIRWGVVSALARIGSPDAMDTVIRALRQHGMTYLRDKHVYRALVASQSPKALKLFLTAFKDENWQTRYKAADALLEIGEPATEPLIAALKDQNSDVRRKAAWVLGKLKAQKAEAALAEVLNDSQWMVRTEANVALMRIKKRSK